MAERGGDFTDDCPNVTTGLFTDCPMIPGYTNGQGYTPNLNVVPAFAEAATINAALLAMIPQPNLSSGNLGSGVLDEWFATPTLPTHWRQELFKVDQNISDKVSANFRYIHDSWNQQYPVPLWTAGTSFPTIQTNFNNPGVSMVARITANVSPTLLNEFVASYTTDHISTNLTGPWARGNVPSTLGLYNNGYGGKVPGVSVSGGRYGGGFAEDPGYVPQGHLNSNPTFTFRDNVTKSRVLGGGRQGVLDLGGRGEVHRVGARLRVLGRARVAPGDGSRPHDGAAMGAGGARIERSRRIH